MSNAGIKSDLQFTEISYTVENQFEERNTEVIETL